MTLKGTKKRGANWHKKNMKRRNKDKRRQKLHNTEFRGLTKQEVKKKQGKEILDEDQETKKQLTRLEAMKKQEFGTKPWPERLLKYLRIKYRYYKNKIKHKLHGKTKEDTNQKTD